MALLSNGLVAANALLLEDMVPGVRNGGLATNKPVYFGGNVVGYIEPLQDVQNQVAAASWAVSHTIFVNDNVSGTYKVSAVSAVFGTASSSGTLQVEVATGTTAVGSGTNQLTGTMSLSGTANTTVNGTVIASPTTITAGARVNLIFGGTVTSLANAVVSVLLTKIS